MRSFMRRNRAVCSYVGCGVCREPFHCRPAAYATVTDRYDVSRTWPSRVGFTHIKLEELTQALSSNISAASASSGGSPSAMAAAAGCWCVEAHVVASHFFAQLGALRASPYGRTCSVTVVLRVREPLSWCATAVGGWERGGRGVGEGWAVRASSVGGGERVWCSLATPSAGRRYRSYYDWAVLGRQRGGEARQQWGANFTDWLPPNLQSALLFLPGYSAQHAVRTSAPRPSRWRRISAALAQVDASRSLPGPLAPMLFSEQPSLAGEGGAALRTSHPPPSPSLPRPAG